MNAQHVVLGCNAYLGKLMPRLAGNIMPINNFVIATEPLPSYLLSRINRDNLSMSDTLFVINYWKLSEDGRMLFGGGENYSSRFPRDIKAFVRPHMLNIYPELDEIEVEYGWGGAVGITMNRMPDFGRVGDAPLVRARVLRSWSAHRHYGGAFTGGSDRRRYQRF